MRELANGGSERLKRHPTYRLLMDQPNEYQTADIFKEQITAHALAWGNGRAYVHRVAGVPVELIPLRPDLTDTYLVDGKKVHVTSPDGDDPLYQLIGEGQFSRLIALADEDVYKIPMLLMIGWRGEPNVHDEPQHLKQGKITLSMLDTMGIKYLVLSDNYKEELPKAIEYIQTLFLMSDGIDTLQLLVSTLNNIKDNIIIDIEEDDDNDYNDPLCSLSTDQIYEYEKLAKNKYLLTPLWNRARS
jgi:hypothetical protein